MEQTMVQDTCTQNNSYGLVAKASIETTRIMATEMENMDEKLDKILELTMELMTHPQEIILNYITKEVWLTFNFITKKGTVKEKVLVNSRANKNMMDIRTAHKLEIQPRPLPNLIGVRNVDRTEN
jgi:hypothetical protein